MVKELGHYQILSEIGRGGMGIVYKAFDEKGKRVVAIKQLVLDNVDPTKQNEFRDRFRRESATAMRLKHPNIVTVFDVSTGEDQHYYVMEFLDGHSLRKEAETRGGRFTPMQFQPILEQVADGLSFAHSMNVVHRDVKPDNIFLLKDGTVKITDFGIARVAEFEQTHLTKTGVMLGTLAYVSPEQLQDAKNVDHRADIFSLGVVTYEALSGQLPFAGDGIAATIVKIVSQDEKPLHIACPAISVDISALVARSMRKKSRDRLRSISEFSREFAELAKSNDHHVSASSAETLTSIEIDELARLDRKPEPDPGLVSTKNPILPEEKTIEYEPKYNVTTEHEFDHSLGPISSATKDRAPGTQTKKAISEPTITPVAFVKEITYWGKEQVPLQEPAVLAYRSGRLIVGDSSSRRLHFYSQDGRWIRDLQQPGAQIGTRSSVGSLTKPSGIAVDSRGRIFVSDSSDNVVRVFDSQGNFTKDIRNIQGKDALGGIQGLAVDSTGLVYISDSGNSCLQVYQSDLGAWMRTVSCKGDKADQLRLPSGLCVDRLNQVYVTDYGLCKVAVFNRTGAYIRSFGAKGPQPGFFNVPRAVAVDRNDRIYVCDSLNHRLQVFGPTGDFLYSIGSRGTEPGKFVGPSSIAIDDENWLLYIADKGNRRIQIFELILG